MSETWTILAELAAATAGGLLGLAGILHALPRLGAPGRAVSEAGQGGLGLDLLVTVFTVLPGAAGFIVAGGWGIVAAVVGQVVAMEVWIVVHELAHREAARGPRIVKVLNARVGWLRNHTAVWVTALAVPLFWIVRLAEWVIYPPLVLLVRFPWYRQREWVNVSRQKFSGLVGWDLIWCLYCDWMTGVWSLGTEMLRNVESFWCPIRFHSQKKCDNCAIDFPDLDGGWVAADKGIADVAALLESKYPPAAVGDAGDAGPRYTWFGHPDRVTVEGRPRGGAMDGSASP